MAWTTDLRRERDPRAQFGWEIIGRMVRRRRHTLRWSQRDLERASGVSQSMISRLENGVLSGMRFSRFARLVAALNGLDLDAPHPPLPKARSGWG